MVSLNTQSAGAERIGELLAREGLLSREQLVLSIEAQKEDYPSVPLGKVCVALGFISSSDLTGVLVKHRRHIHIGDLLVHLGLLQTDQLQEALDYQKSHHPKKKLGELLLEKGLVDESALIRVLYKQSQQVDSPAKRTGGKFAALIHYGRLQQQELDAIVNQAEREKSSVETLLMKKKHLTKHELGAALSAYYQCPFVEYDENFLIAPECVNGINPNYLKTNYWIPLRVTDKIVDVMIDDPHSHDRLRDIRRLHPGKKIKCFVGLREDILQYVNAVGTNLQGSAIRESVSMILGQLDVLEEDASETSVEQLINENNSAIVRLVNQLIVDACNQRVSDIHIEPQGSERETKIRFRVDGRCFDYLLVPAAYRRALVSRLKIMAGMDIAERRKPQDGKIKFQIGDRAIELRVATIPTSGAGNEDMVMRILAAEEPIPLDRLKMTPRNLREFRSLLDKPYGLILCVGPTGSGKTTTLHSALGAINTPDRKIWTAEDPVEITQPGLRQVQVNAKIGFDFATAMRAFLRADPDVIMVGEIRDHETAEVAIDASLTGHLVLSTLHTNSAVETVSRLLEMGIDPFNFADSLLGVLAQRLARTLCLECRESYHPGRDEYDTLAHGFGEEAFAQLKIPYDDRFLLYRSSKGCPSCRDTGYKGRFGLHELLLVSDEIKKLINTRATVSEMFKVARAQEMTTLVQDGILKVLQGWTDYAQIRAAATR
jgi:type II secretory ATPase GspE/PulE/Tfp pilus assembly ATPase PilB-like protein